MKKCTYCAEHNPDAAKVCERCGRQLSKRRKKPPNIGTILAIAGIIFSIGTLAILSYMAYLDGSLEPILAAPLTYVCCSMGPIVFFVGLIVRTYTR